MDNSSVPAQYTILPCIAHMEKHRDHQCSEGFSHLLIALFCCRVYVRICLVTRLLCSGGGVETQAAGPYTTKLAHLAVHYG